MKVRIPPVPALKLLSLKVAEESDADVVLYTGSIEEPADFELIGRVGRLGKRKNVILILTTFGGIADVAYRMMRFLQGRYHDGKISAFVPHICKSAGTLMVIGADELVMSSYSELGPLDVQVSKPDEVGEWTSGLTPLQSLTAIRSEAFNCFEQHFLSLRERSGKQITAKTAADIAAKLTIGWFQPMYEQIDPMRLGETMRAMTIARAYGVRLSRGNIDLESLDDLISSYPSHGFVIDRAEAKELFCNVRKPTQAEADLSTALMSSKFADAGLTGPSPVVRVISVEDCNFAVDNEWEGIEHEQQDHQENHAETREPSGKRSRSRKVVGAGNPKSVPSGRTAEAASGPTGSHSSGVDSNGPVTR